MRYDKPITNCGATIGEFLCESAELETEECEALERQVPEAVRIRYEADQHRWPSQAVLTVLSAFERSGASGFSVTRVDGRLVFAPVGAPAYLSKEVA